jgi:hypothetical protein
MTTDYRDIHCRAKTLEAGEWVYGSLVLREQDVHGTPGYFISGFGGYWMRVDPETIGQYLGVHSIDDTRVYEGDQLLFPGDHTEYTAAWLPDEGAWGIMYSKSLAMGKAGICQFMQVVGNIHDSQKPAQ